MRMSVRVLGATVSVVALLAAGAVTLAQTGAEPPRVDADDIGGVLTGPGGPEAGVWVVAETRDLGVRFVRIVVTDDRGRFLVPDLPKGRYQVWARGYGLADSAKVEAQPGAQVRLTARAAASAAEAAKVYPAAYWYSMLKVPAKADFAPGSRHPDIGDEVVSQEAWLTRMKNAGCVGCHQMGNEATRVIPAEFRAMGSEGAWMRRVSSGQAGPNMTNQLGALGPLSVKLLADWTDRIAAGETPTARPERPQGIERNVVVTVRDWLNEEDYLHDLISTDRRNPTVNAHGPLYGATELSVDLMPILDPVKNTATAFKLPVRDADTPPSGGEVMQPSHYWGDRAIWDSKANVHNPMLDQHGRVWLTAAVRGPDNPAYCKQGSSHPSARVFPSDRAGRHLAVYEPRTQKYTFVETCYSTHHLQFDKNDVLWTSGGEPVLGWLDMKVFDRTGSAEQAQGWTPIVLDSNGNGRRDAFVEPGAPADPAKDRRINAPFYAIMPNPADGSVWGAVFRYPGSVVRVVPGANPSETALAEVYDVPLPGFGVRGGDIDSKGVVWVSLGSGHLGSFDRSKCRGPLNGPRATGGHCPEGWSFFRLPGPSFAGVPDQSVESSYYTWVDQHNTLGLGRDVPVVTGNLFDGLHALVNGRFVTLRVPYPLGFYAKGLDGRIDAPNGGWKGRGIWTSSGDRTPWHMEGGKGNKPLAVHFQVRPNPLAG